MEALKQQLGFKLGFVTLWDKMTSQVFPEQNLKPRQQFDEQ